MSETIMDGIGWNFEHSYISLPPSLFSRVNPTPVSEPKPVLINYVLAKELGLHFSPENLQEVSEQLAGNKLPAGSHPIAQAYMGHQFGYPNMLGDGRAILLGEHLTPDGRRMDIQLKGSGQTPYSRRGDGRAALGSMLREYIFSEAMHHLGIPSTRSLAVISTGEPVYRETVQEGAILTRVASSHIRVGTVEFATRHLEIDSFNQFIHYCIQRHYPQLAGSDQPAIDLLKAVMERQADLVVNWMRVGFIHGVMNTDNMSLSGETIDFGPCAFMNSYDPATVFSSIDTEGRYAFANQPAIAQWNLAVLASALLPLIDHNTEKAIEQAKAVIQTFAGKYAEKWLNMMRGKLGLITKLEGDKSLADSLLQWMQEQSADYTNTFYQLSTNHYPKGDIYLEEGFKLWYNNWKTRLAENEAPEQVALFLMQKNNPAYIPRNHRVEEALEAATLGKDMSGIYKLLEVLEQPYNYREKFAGYQQPPVGGDTYYKTFCNT